MNNVVKTFLTFVTVLILSSVAFANGEKAPKNTTKQYRSKTYR